MNRRSRRAVDELAGRPSVWGWRLAESDAVAWAGLLLALGAMAVRTMLFGA